MALGPDGALRTVASGFDYCNGIEIEDDSALIVTDHSQLFRVRMDGGIQRLASHIDFPMLDGLTLDLEGRIYLAMTRLSGVQILEGDQALDFLEIDGEGSTSNCCFGGPDNRWLFATDTRKGRIMVWTDTPSPGRSATPWTPLV
jgi:sugar lactone lactonase YvrE